MMRKINEIRLQNLEALIVEAGSAAKLAKTAGTNSSYLSQVRHQSPTRKGTPRAIGDDLAEKLETTMKKPQGWMDIQHMDDTPQPKPPQAHDTSRLHNLHPLIPWSDVKNWYERSDKFISAHDVELLPCPVKCSSETFVLTVQGSSMEPKFHDNDLLFVDPNADVENGNFVVALQEGSNEAVFRQLIIEAGKHYFKALNPDWPNRIVEIGVDDTLCGVIIFKGEVM